MKQPLTILHESARSNFGCTTENAVFKQLKRFQSGSFLQKPILQEKAADIF
jgi:hypothetical protein